MIGTDAREAAHLLRERLALDWWTNARGALFVKAPDGLPLVIGPLSVEALLKADLLPPRPAEVLRNDLAFARRPSSSTRRT